MTLIDTFLSYLNPFPSTTDALSVKNIANFFTYLNQKLTNRSVTAASGKESCLKLKTAAKDSIHLLLEDACFQRLVKRFNSRQNTAGMQVAF